MAPRRRSEIYRLAVGLVELGVFVAKFDRLRFGTLDQGLAATLVVCGVLAMQFPSTST